MMRKLLPLLLFLAFSSLASADAVVNVGVGKGIFGAPGTPFERSVSGGYQWVIGTDFFVRPEAGWFEDLSGHGESSLWVSPLIGVRTISHFGPELHIAVGPAYLQNPDQVLGGHFQFSLEGGVGISDGKTSLGLEWKHLSSAGIEMPNQGRDFISIQLRILIL